MRPRTYEPRHPSIVLLSYRKGIKIWPTDARSRVLFLDLLRSACLPPSAYKYISVLCVSRIRSAIASFWDIRSRTSKNFPPLKLPLRCLFVFTRLTNDGELILLIFHVGTGAAKKNSRSHSTGTASNAWTQHFHLRCTSTVCLYE